MERYFSKFNVEIIDEKFRNDLIIATKTAVVSLFDDNNEVIEQLKLAVVLPETIYKKIDNAEPLIFPHSYIDGFSLSNYRKDSGEQTKIKIYDLNFENSFFDYSNVEQSKIDFVNVEFAGELTNFKNSAFVRATEISFSNSLFSGSVSFEYSLFNNLDVDFSNTIFKGQSVSFKNAIFKKGLANFENVSFHSELVSFVNTEFGEGDAMFSNSVFYNSDILFKVARFGKGRIDFHKVNFGNGLKSFEKVEFGDGDINFRTSYFGAGDVEFTRCVFGAGDVSFIAANFEKGDVSFAGTEFGTGKLSFKQAYFGGGKLDFHYAHFGVGDVIFERTNFVKGNVDFRAVDFGIGKITFNRAYFGQGEIVFEASELKSGRITFRKTMFGSGVFNFEMADFSNAELIIDDVNFGQGKVSFKQSKFALLSLESSQMNNYFDLRVEECGKLDLSGTIVKDIIDIDSSEYRTNIKAIDLNGIRLLGRIYIDWKQNNVKELILQQKTSHANKAAQFRLLKENYNLIGQYEYEDEAYVEFKRAESKSILENSKQKKLISRIRSKISYFFQLVVFDKVGLYATNPIRVLLSMTFVYLAFSLLFIALQLITHESSIISSLFSEGDPRDLSMIQKSFYHSAITFLTIGYGDYYPSGIIRWLSAIEGFLGLFLMSYFTVAFVRKILR
jgi:hypothetical protein